MLGAALRRRSRPEPPRRTGSPRRNRLASLADDPRNVKVLGVEQSNSSAIVDNQLIAKLVRRLEPGLNPDVELPAHLAAAGFEHVPGVAATLDIDLPAKQLPANVVMVHDAIAHESDLWVKVLDDLGLAIDHGVPFDERPPTTSGRRSRRCSVGAPPRLHQALARTDVTAPMQRDGARRWRQSRSPCSGNARSSRPLRNSVRDNPA